MNTQYIKSSGNQTTLSHYNNAALKGVRNASKFGLVLFGFTDDPRRDAACRFSTPGSRVLGALAQSGDFLFFNTSKIPGFDASKNVNQQLDSLQAELTRYAHNFSHSRPEECGLSFMLQMAFDSTRLGAIPGSEYYLGWGKSFAAIRDFYYSGVRHSTCREEEIKRKKKIAAEKATIRAALEAEKAAATLPTDSLLEKSIKEKALQLFNARRAAKHMDTYGECLKEIRAIYNSY